MNRETKTPEVRRFLHTIRKNWISTNDATPFMFTSDLDSNHTIESFCVKFISNKYNVS